MRVTINRQEFLDAFNAIADVIPKSSPLVAAQSALLEATSAFATLTATNMERSIIKTIPLRVDEPGKVLLSSRFHQILRSSSDVALTLFTEGTNLIVKGNRSKHKMPLEDPAAFPEVPGFTATDFFRLSASELKQAIKQTVYVCSAARSPTSSEGGSNNHTYAGVQFLLDQKEGKLASFDGGRFAAFDLSFAVEGDPYKSTVPVVPSGTLKLLERILEGDGVVDFAFDKNAAYFSYDGNVIWTRLLEGKPVNARRAVDLCFPDRAEVKAGALKEAVANAAVMVSEESRGVTFNIADGRISVSAETAEIGDSEVDVDASWSTDARSFRLDHRFALAPLGVLDADDSVSVGVIDSKSPILFQCGKSTALLMPMEVHKKGA